MPASPRAFAARERRAAEYKAAVPGDRVQMDVCKIGLGLYQYTAIDDCSRFQVLRTYPRRNAKSTLDFLEQVVEEMPFAIQRIQTDRGQEFLAYEVQDRICEWISSSVRSGRARRT